MPVSVMATYRTLTPAFMVRVRLATFGFLVFHKLNPFVCHRRKPTAFRRWVVDRDLLYHLRRKAVIKGTSNAPGGFAVKPWTIHCTGLVCSMRGNTDFVHTL